MKRFLLPLALFLVLVGFLAVGLRLDPREVPSPLVDKPAPAFQLAKLAQGACGAIPIVLVEKGDGRRPRLGIR